MLTAFCQATRSSVPFILTAILGWVILFREHYQLTLLVTLKTRVSHLRTGFQNWKRGKIRMQALIKRDMLLAASCELLNTNFCERNQFLVCIKRLSKFSVQMLRDMYLIFVKTVVVIIKSTEVPLNTWHKCIVIASREGGGGVLPYIGYIGMCGNKEYGFLAGLVFKKGYQFRPVWSGYVFF